MDSYSKTLKSRESRLEDEEKYLKIITLLILTEENKPCNERLELQDSKIEGRLTKEEIKPKGGDFKLTDCLKVRPMTVIPGPTRLGRRP